MTAWIDDFEGNKLSKKWVATRISDGGQNDGVYAHEVKNSKVRFTATSQGTEASYWGEFLKLPINVNAVGNIIVDARIRHKSNGSAGPEGIGIGFNQQGFTFNVNKGIFVSNNLLELRMTGRDTGAAQPFPARPAQQTMWLSAIGDAILDVHIVRKNGRMFVYGNNVYLCSYAYAVALTDVSIVADRYTDRFSSEFYCDFIRVTPESVVL